MRERSIEDIRTTGAGWVTEAELDSLCDELSQLRAALVGIAAFGNVNCGYGFSCAKMAEAALERPETANA